MKTRQLVYFIIGFIVITILPVSAQQNPIQDLEAAVSDSTQSPSAIIMQSRFEFEPVVDGTEVIHDFVILNAGSAPLSIRDVITNCSCAKAKFPKEILPGNEGQITIIFDTTGYGGMTSDRDIMVSTNDPKKSVFYLNMSGKIEAFAKLDPKIIVLRGSSKNKIQTIVTITPDEKYPFTLLSTEMDDNLKKKVTIKVKKENGKYILTAENITKTSGRYRGVIYLKIDSPIKPEIKMMVKGFID